MILPALILGFTISATASLIPDGGYLQFAFTTAGVSATGCFPADPTGAVCLPSSGTPTTFAPAPPWTFTAPATGALFTVVDAFEAGDRFQVFDFGASLGLTSAPVGSADCGNDPVPCLAAAGTSKGTFTLAPGDHSITIVSTLAPLGRGSGYFRVDLIPVPEPVSWVLSCAGLGLLVMFRRRSRTRTITGW